MKIVRNFAFSFTVFRIIKIRDCVRRLVDAKSTLNELVKDRYQQTEAVKCERTVVSKKPKNWYF